MDTWNATLYDSHHHFVSDYGKDVIQLLQVKKGERILDLGCGTGELTAQLHELGANVVGVDKSKNMVEQAQKKYPYLPFYVKDVTNLQYDNEFDSVFSNAVLHWVKDGETALQNIFRSLKKNGKFVAEFGGKNNIKTITEALRSQFEQMGINSDERWPWYFPTIGEYTSLMEKVGFHVKVAIHIDRPTPLEGEEGLYHWLTMFTTSMFEHIDAQTKETILSNIVNQLRHSLYKDGKWVLDYKRIRVVGIKEEENDHY